MQLTKRVSIIAVATALCLVAFAGTALAYFSDLTIANGQKSINLGYSTETVEEKDGLDKHIVMTNTGDTDVMVRVQMFYPTSDPDTIKVTVEGTNWREVEGSEAHMFVYDKVLAPGEETEILLATVDIKNVEAAPNQFDVIVVGQTAPAVYNADGVAHGFGWN